MKRHTLTYVMARSFIFHAVLLILGLVGWATNASWSWFIAWWVAFVGNLVVVVVGALRSK